MITKIRPICLYCNIIYLCEVNLIQTLKHVYVQFFNMNLKQI
jgi:hypothetical protein